MDHLLLSFSFPTLEGASKVCSGQTDQYNILGVMMGFSRTAKRLRMDIQELMKLHPFPLNLRHWRLWSRGEMSCRVPALTFPTVDYPRSGVVPSTNRLRRSIDSRSTQPAGDRSLELWAIVFPLHDAMSALDRKWKRKKKGVGNAPNEFDTSLSIPSLRML